jgi:hypothetical protein
VAEETTAAPTMKPPEKTGEASVQEAPVDLDDELLAQAAADAVEGETPTLEPPAESAAAAEAVGAWLSDKRVSALWGNNAARNSWVYVMGVGWKKLYNASDSSVIAMTMLGAHARQLNARFDYREESDGMIHEIYVW